MDKREWGNNRIAEEISGKSLTKTQRSKIFKKVWKEAKRKYG
jgi:hypothetical protein